MVAMRTRPTHRNTQFQISECRFQNGRTAVPLGPEFFLNMWNRWNIGQIRRIQPTYEDGAVPLTSKPRTVQFSKISTQHHVARGKHACCVFCGEIDVRSFGEDRSSHRRKKGRNFGGEVKRQESAVGCADGMKNYHRELSAAKPQPRVFEGPLSG